MTIELQYEDKSAIPEDLADNYVEFKEGDKTLFMHKDLAETKKALYRTKGDYTKLSSDFETTKERLQRLEDERKERERQEAERKEKNLKDNGKHDELLDAYKKKAEETEEEWRNRYNELQNQFYGEKKNSVVSKFAAQGTKETQTALARLIGQDLSVNEKGEFVVLDENGKATAMSLEEYEKSIPERYPSLVRGPQSSGGHGNGGNAGSGSSAKTVTRSELEAMNQKDRYSFFEKGGKVVDD